MTNREIFEAVARREMTPEQGVVEMLAEDARRRSPFERWVMKAAWLLADLCHRFLP